MVQKQALNGVKVLGFVTMGVGPILLKNLAINGASVVQVESIKRPDLQRTNLPFKDNKPGLNRAYRFAFCNSDRYGISLDLKHPLAKEVTRRLVNWADVIVDNYRPGVMERWGLSYDEARAIKPEIIMIGLTQQGHTGPHQAVASYGPQLAGYAGFHELAGWPDRSPCGVGPYPDVIAPRFGAVMVLAALDYRRRTGKGQYIDASQYEAAIQFLAPAILDYTANGRIQSRNGNKSLNAVPHGVYRCKGDDEWCAIAVFTDSEWEAFCKVIAKPAWTQEARFSTFAGRKEHEDELNRHVEEWAVERSAEKVMAMMQQAGVDAGKVRTVADIVENCPQIKYRHYIRTVEHPEMGPTLVDGTSYNLSKTPYQIQRPAPCLGEHTEYVCTKFLGMSDKEFINLNQEGVFD